MILKYIHFEEPGKVKVISLDKLYEFDKRIYERVTEKPYDKTNYIEYQKKLLEEKKKKGIILDYQIEEG